jgi:hypothetical protein
MHTTLATTISTPEPATEPAMVALAFHFHGHFQELEAISADGRWFFFWLLDGEPVELDPHKLGSRAEN